MFLRPFFAFLPFLHIRYTGFLIFVCLFTEILTIFVESEGVKRIDAAIQSQMENSDDGYKTMRDDENYESFYEIYQSK